jgi:hypothetical protein
MTDLLGDIPVVPDCPRRFQYSLRTLFIVSFVFAFFFAGVFCKYDAIRNMTSILASVLYSCILLSFAIYCPGYLRSFAIGALFSLSFLMFPAFPDEVYMRLDTVPSYGLDERFDFTKVSAMEAGLHFFVPSLIFLGIFVYSCFAGTAMVVTRWLIESSQRQAAKQAVGEIKTLDIPSKALSD